jgi:hypothetical protein
MMLSTWHLSPGHVQGDSSGVRDRAQNGRRTGTLVTLLAEGGELFGLDQTILRHLQLAQRRLRRVSRRADGFFGLLPLDNVSIDQYETAVGYRIPAHLDDATVRASAFEPQLPSCVIEAAGQFRLKIGRILATPGKIAEIFRVARPLCKEVIGQIKNFLKLRFHATRRVSAPNMTTPSPILSKVTRNSA